MAAARISHAGGFPSIISSHSVWWRASVRSKPAYRLQYRRFATEPTSQSSASSSQNCEASASTSTKPSPVPKSPQAAKSSSNTSLPDGWEDNVRKDISQFSQLPHKDFGSNQHMVVNAEFKEALRQVLWQFKAPIRYAFAYGSGVFSQSSTIASSSLSSPHPHAPEAVTKWQASGGKSIDFIFGVSYTQHWHDLNIQQHRDHYSFLGSLGSNIVAKVQDNFGAGAYFNPYVIVNGVMIKYGVVNLDTLYRDLSDWDTLYTAGRLHKPVKILRDDPRIRLANQKNLISALRTALLMLPERFTEHDLYTKIASLSYIGDPRMAFRAENPRKVADIVDNQLVNFRQLYLPLIDDLPNVAFKDLRLRQPGWADSPSFDLRIEQNMDPVKRGNMVRRLPKSFRKKIYYAYQDVFRMPANEFNAFMEECKDDDLFSSRMGGEFDKRIAASEHIDTMVAEVVKKTINRPSLTQSVKGVISAGPSKSYRYFMEKLQKGRMNKQGKSTTQAEDDVKSAEIGASTTKKN